MASARAPRDGTRTIRARGEPGTFPATDSRPRRPGKRAPSARWYSEAEGEEERKGQTKKGRGGVAAAAAVAALLLLLLSCPRVLIRSGCGASSAGVGVSQCENTEYPIPNTEQTKYTAYDYGGAEAGFLE